MFRSNREYHLTRTVSVFDFDFLLLFKNATLCRVLLIYIDHTIALSVGINE